MEFNLKKYSWSKIIIRYGIENKIKIANFKANISIYLSMKYSIYDVIINIEKKIDIFGFLLLNNIFMNEYIDLINLFSLFLSFLSRFFEKVFGILVPFNWFWYWDIFCDFIDEEFICWFLFFGI